VEKKEIREYPPAQTPLQYGVFQGGAGDQAKKGEHDL
jgi:hypothetical protein